jgi:hypothetical protein
LVASFIQARTAVEQIMLMALFRHDQARCRCRLIGVKRTSRFRSQSSDARLQRNELTLAPADDGAFRLN